MTDEERAADPTTPAEELEALARRSEELRLLVAANAGAPVALLESLLRVGSDYAPSDHTFSGLQTGDVLNAIGLNPSLELQWLIDPQFPSQVRDSRGRWLFTYLYGYLPPRDDHYPPVDQEDLDRALQVLKGTSLRRYVADEGRRILKQPNVKLEFRDVVRDVRNAAIRTMDKTLNEGIRSARSAGVAWLFAEKWRAALQPDRHYGLLPLDPGILRIAHYFAPPELVP